MKTITIKTAIIAITILTSISTIAQKVYVDVNVGYALPLKGGIDRASTTTTTYYNEQTGESNRSENYKSINSSLGKGLNFGGSIGYMFNKNIGFELGLNYILGAAIKMEDISNDTYIDFTGATQKNTSNYTSSTSSNMFQIAPTLVLSTGFEKFNPYAKFGFVMGFGKVTSQSESTATNWGNSNRISEYSGGMGFGFTGSIGADYALNEKVSLFSELKFMSFSYAPKKGIITKYTQDGVDQLPNMTTSQKETEFVKEFTVDGSNDNEPSKQTKSYVPYNNIGLNFGVKFSF